MKNRKKLAILLAVCAALGLSGCGAEAPGAAEASTVPPAVETETAPDNGPLIRELMEGYLAREDTGRENITTHFGVNAAHSGVAAEYIEDYCVNDMGQICVTSQMPFVSPINEAPKWEEEMARMEAELPPDAVMVSFEDSLLPPQKVTYDPEALEDTRSSFYILSDQGIYHDLAYIWMMNEPEGRWRTHAVFGSIGLKYCALSTMPKQDEKAVLRDMLDREDLFTLEKSSFDGQPCLAVHYDMASSCLRLFHPEIIPQLFGYEENWEFPYRLQDAPAHVTVYFDAADHACLGMTVDASDSARVLQEKLLKKANVAQGDGLYTVTWRFLPSSFVELPLADAYPTVRTDPHTVVVSGEDQTSPSHYDSIHHSPIFSIHSDFDLVFNPKTQQFDVYEDGVQIGVLQSHVGHGYSMDEFCGELVQMLDQTEGNLTGNLYRADVGFEFQEPESPREELAYYVTCEDAHQRGAMILSWSKEDVLRIFESLTIS